MKQKLVAIIVCVMTMIIGVNSSHAQRNLYHRVELGSGNAWTFVAMEGLAIGMNQWAKKPLVEASLRFSIPNTSYGNLDSYQGFGDFGGDSYSSDEEEESDLGGFVGFHMRELFSNVIIGDKVGYLSDNMGFLNYCIYGAGYYNIQQFKLLDEYNDDWTPLNTQRLQLGGGAMVILGSIESRSRWIIDGGVRYNIPVYFGGSGIEGSTNDILSKGISSHYMVKWSMRNQIAVGFTADIMHYNMFKDENLVGEKSKVVEFGIVVMALFN